MTTPGSTPAEKMNRMYRFTRHVYDASRRPYLLGRDRLVERMARAEIGAVLEVGCGTARNLIALHAQAPHLQLYGLDAADVMLDTARQAIARAGCTDRITLAQGLAENLDPAALFGRSQPFDAVFFSYALSMMPAWRPAVNAALRHLTPGGRLYIVDFWDQADLPCWFAGLLQWWLSHFGVHFRPAVHGHLLRLQSRGEARVAIEPVVRRYAYIAVVQRLPEGEDVAADLGSPYDFVTK